MNDDAHTPTSEADAEPLFEVVKGDPTPTEFAALVAVLSAKLTAGTTTQPDAATWHAAPRWAAYWRSTQLPLRPGPGAWRASALPR
jgi:hypothetical protein